MAGAFWIGRGLRLGSKTEADLKEVKAIKAYTVAVDPANQAGAGQFEMNVTVTGAEVGDGVIAVPPTTLEANLRHVSAMVSAANTIRLVLQAAAAVDGASLNWTFILIR